MWGVSDAALPCRVSQLRPQFIFMRRDVYVTVTASLLTFQQSLRVPSWVRYHKLDGTCVHIRRPLPVLNTTCAHPRYQSTENGRPYNQLAPHLHIYNVVPWSMERGTKTRLKNYLQLQRPLVTTVRTLHSSRTRHQYASLQKRIQKLQSTMNDAQKHLTRNRQQDLG